MFRKTSGAILCPSCGRLTNADAPSCLVCGRRNPGMWGFAGPLRALFRRRSFVDVVTVACIVLYVASLVFDLRGALRPRGVLDVLSPSIEALFALGATGSVAWHLGRWWTLLTAIYLHGNVLHILFNVLWIRQLGPAIEQLYGPSRLVIIFTVAGVTGFLASNLLGLPLTIGASGSIFGLLGAMVAFGAEARRHSRRDDLAAVRTVGPAPVRPRLPDAGSQQHRPCRRLRRRVRRRAGAGAGRASGRDRIRSAAGHGLHRPDAARLRAGHLERRPRLNVRTPGLSIEPGRCGDLPRQRPTLPRSCPRSTIGLGGLNFRVRDGNGCGPSGNGHRESNRTGAIGRRLNRIPRCVRATACIPPYSNDE